MALPSLYLIADPNTYEKGRREDLDAFFEGLREAIAGGLRFVQYRDKFRSRAEMFAIAKRLREITGEGGATLIINDEIDLAMAVKADGVHLGQNDFPVEMARKLLGKSVIIGLSTHNPAEAREAMSQPLDYIGFGPIFPTTTKQAHAPALGIAGIRKMREYPSLPVYAIGGIQFRHLQDIVAAGASGVAVASALCGVDRSVLGQWKKRLEMALAENTHT